MEDVVSANTVYTCPSCGQVLTVGERCGAHTPEDLLYLNVHQAAQISGVGEKQVRQWMNSADPPPMLEYGNKRLIQREGWKSYLERKQTTRERR